MPQKSVSRKPLLLRVHVPRKSANERGYTGRWQEYSTRLRIENPHCVACKILRDGRLEGSEEVDHKTPKEIDPDAFWDTTNHWCLCSRHHGMKTRRERFASRSEMLGWRHLSDEELVNRIFSNDSGPPVSSH